MEEAADAHDSVFCFGFSLHLLVSGASFIFNGAVMRIHGFTQKHDSTNGLDQGSQMLKLQI